jgi:hypothetical protein
MELFDLDHELEGTRPQMTHEDQRQLRARDLLFEKIETVAKCLEELAIAKQLAHDAIGEFAPLVTDHGGRTGSLALQIDFDQSLGHRALALAARESQRDGSRQRLGIRIETGRCHVELGNPIALLGWRRRARRRCQHFDGELSALVHRPERPNELVDLFSSYAQISTFRVP